MTTVVIIDDEAKARHNLRQMLDIFADDIQILGEANGVQSGFALVTEVKPSIVFLDIQMQDGSGFDLLKQFSKPAFHVIFTTAFDQFALKAFEVNAIDYLLKPIDPSTLQRALEKATAQRVSPIYDQQLAELIRVMRQEEIDKIALYFNPKNAPSPYPYRITPP
jgi:two-component system LytT family response regulator